MASDPLAAYNLPEDQLQLARKYYSDEQISQFLSQRDSGVSDTKPIPSTIANVDRSQGESFIPRLMASFKSTPQERADFWKKYRGAENMTVTPAGEILVRAEKGWKPIDEAGIGIGDLADLAGDVPEFAAMLMSGGESGILKMMAKAGLRTGAANIGKQVIGSTLPGESDRGLLARAGETVKSGVGAAIASPLGASPDIPITPGRIATKIIRDRLERLRQGNIAQEGDRLIKSTGFPLDIAEETQDPMMKMVAGFAYRNAFGQEQAALNQKAKDNAALAMLQRLSSRLGQEGGFGDQTLGEAASRAVGQSLNDVRSGLKDTSDRYFHFLQTQLGTRQIPVNNYRAKLLSQADYYDSMETATGRSLARELRAAANDMRTQPGTNELSMGPGTLNARAIQEHLENLGTTSYGKEGPKFFRNMRLYGKTRELKQLHEALRQDLAAAEGEMGRQRAPAKALLDARRAWESEQAALNQLQDLPLVKFLESKGALPQLTDQAGNLVGHEHVTDYLVKGMKSGKIAPSEISNMVKMLTAANSSFPHELASGLINNAIKVGRDNAKNRPSQFSYEEAYKALPSPEHLEAIYKDIWNPGHKATGKEIASQIKDLMSAIERSNVAGQGIPTAPGTTLVNIGSNLSEGNFKTAGKNFLAHVFLPKKVASFVSDPAMRDAMLSELERGGSRNRAFIPTWARESLPALMYELGSVAQQPNQQTAGR